MLNTVLLLRYSALIALRNKGSWKNKSTSSKQPYSWTLGRIHSLSPIQCVTKCTLYQPVICKVNVFVCSYLSDKNVIINLNYFFLLKESWQEREKVNPGEMHDGIVSVWTSLLTLVVWCWPIHRKSWMCVIYSQSGGKILLQIFFYISMI